MTNKQIIEKMTEDMEMRGFSKWTKESYLSKTKDVMKYCKRSTKGRIEASSLILYNRGRT